MTLTILQCNMNRSSVAHALLPQIAAETDADVLIISEQYRDIPGPAWTANDSGTAAIWARGGNATRITERGSGEDFVWIRVGTVVIASVYLTPNCSAREFELKLEILEDALQGIRGNCIVAGDFNARAVDWGMPSTNRRGRLLLDMAARLDLAVVNEGTTPTYRRPGYGNSIPDVTLATDGLLTRLRGWRVIEDYTASDHQYITFALTDDNATNRSRSSLPPRWDTKRLNTDELSRQLQYAVTHTETTPDGQNDRGTAETLAKDTERYLLRLCESTMPRKRYVRDRRQTYWWTGEISELRKECCRLRRQAQRRGNRDDGAESSERYKLSRKRLRSAINDSKRQCWRRLTDEVDSDPWGAGYKIVTGKLGSRKPPETKDADAMEKIVEGLFPTHADRTDDTDDDLTTECPLFTREELERAASLLKPNKAPGPDGVPGELIRLVVQKRPQVLLDLYNGCLAAGVFSKLWKNALLVLISKGKGDPEAPSSYRPLSLLNTTGKLFELLIRPRLTEAVQAAGDLSDRQYGFRKGRSTIGAVAEVLRAVDETTKVCHGARPLVLLVTLDVRNAFNSARWVDILEALETVFRVPPYLCRVIRDYLRDRRLTYETTNGRRQRRITAGVAQGSILGPDFWNILYDGLLRLDMPTDTRLVAYADDVAVIITARDTHLAQLKVNQVMRRVNEWMTDHGLQLALQKTELLLLTRKRIDTLVPMTVGTEQLVTSGEVKYLGVTLDTKLSFWPHIRNATTRAADKTKALSRLMANTNGPRPSTRRLMMSVTHSIMLYGAEVWADTLLVKRRATAMTRVQRVGALRIASAYRTVSENAIFVIAGVVPIDLLALERKRIYERSADVGRAEATLNERTNTLERWQTRWTTNEQGRWTRRLIPRLGPWMDRNHGEVNFYLTQFLSGHGYFRKYLHSMGKVTSPECKYCGWPTDDAEHTFFVCDRWTERRTRVETETGTITPDNVTTIMTSNEDKWRTIATYVTSVLLGKKDDGCLEN